MAKIYVSATYNDLIEFRARARAAISQMNHEAAGMENYVAESRQPLSKCQEDVRSSDLYIGIFAFRYGFIPAGQEESITVLEYREAIRSKKDCLIFLLHEDALWPDTKIEQDQYSKILAFREEVSGRHMVGFFSNIDNLESAITKAISNWEKKKTNIRQFPLFTLLIPSLPSFYIDRATEVKKITGHLLKSGPDYANTIIIHGMPGGGKTTIAAGICQSKLVKDHFKDRIIWLTLGQKPDCLSILATCIRELDDKEYNPTTLHAATRYLRALLHSSSYLIVLDDVWDADTLQHFLVAGENSKLLVTTRRLDIIDDRDMVVLPLDELTEDEACALLEKRVQAGRGVAELSDAEKVWARKLSEEAGHLPLALNLIGALVARKYSWEETLDALKMTFNRISGRSDPLSKLKGSIQLSLDWMKKEDEVSWRNFCMLGVLSVDPRINKKLIAILLDCPEMEAAAFLNYLSDEALLSRDNTGYTIHDLIHEMARALLHTPPPAGMGISPADAHAQLLERYKKAAGDQGWAGLPNDGYIHANLFYHLQHAGMLEEQYQLLCAAHPDGRNLWYTVREALSDTAGFLDDVKRVWQNERASDTFRLQRHIRLALMTSSVHTLAQTIPLDLLSFLLEKGIWSPLKTINSVYQFSDPGKKGAALLEILPLINAIRKNLSVVEDANLSYQIKIVVEETVQTLIAIGESFEEARLLVKLSSYVQLPMKEEAVGKAIAICKKEPRLLQFLTQAASTDIKDFIVESACEHYKTFPDKLRAAKMISEVLTELSLDKRPKWISLIRGLVKELIAGMEQKRSDVARPVSRANPPATHAGTVNKSNNPLAVQTLPGNPEYELKEDTDALTSLLYALLNKKIIRPEEWKEELSLFYSDTDLNDIFSSVDESSTADWPPHKEGEDLSIEQRCENFLTALNVKLFDSIELIKILPGSRAGFIRKVLDMFWTAHSERIGHFMVKVVQYISPDECRSLCRHLIDKGKGSIGVNCILLSLEPQPQRENMYGSILKDLRRLVRSYQEHYYSLDAIYSIAATCPEPVTLESLQIVQHIGDERSQISALFLFAPFLKDGVTSGMLEHLFDEKIYGRQIATLTRLVYELSGLIKRGKLTEFITSASELSAEWWVVEALTMALKKLSALEEILTVADACQHLHNDDLRARILGRTAYKLAISGHPSEALEILKKISLLIERWRIMGDIAADLTKNGYLNIAEDLAHSIDEPEEQGKALANLALFHAVSGNSIKAEEITAQIGSGAWRQYVSQLLNSEDKREKSNILPSISGQENKPMSPPTNNDLHPSAPDDIELDSPAILTVLKDWAPHNKPEVFLQIPQFGPFDESAKKFWSQPLEKGRTLLEILSEQPRPVVFENLKKLSTLIIRTAGEDDIVSIVEAISDSCTWWP